MKSKKPINQDCKVILGFLKLVARETTHTTLRSWLTECLLFFDVF